MTERASVVEQAQTDVLGYQAENKGTDLQKSQLQSVLEIYFKNVPDLTDMSDSEILNTELETLAIYGTHNITVKEIFDGSFSNENESSSKKSVADLREGDEVIYTDGNGNTIPCIVLYDSTGSYGIQIISKDTVGEDIELGNGTGNTSESKDSSHFFTAKEIYNTVVAKLNREAAKYINTELATNARCVGSNPSETPITEETDTGTYTNTYSYFSSPVNYNNQFKSESGFSNTDRTQMQKENINCYTIGKNYWLAWRYSTANANFSSFSVRAVGATGNINYVYMCYVMKNGDTCSVSNANGFRPIFILDSTTHYTDKNGTKKLIK